MSINLNQFLGKITDEMMEAAEVVGLQGEQRQERVKTFADGTPVKESHCPKPDRLKGRLNAREWSEQLMGGLE